MFHTFVFCSLCFWCLVVCCDVKTVSVTEGDSVTLHSNLTEIQRDGLLTWTFGDQQSLIATINKEAGILKTSDVPDGRFRDRLKLDNQTGSLTITNTKTTDSGVYLLTNSGKTETQYRFNVTVYGIKHINPVLTPLAVSGSLVIVAAVGIFWINRKHRKTREEVKISEEEITYADPTYRKLNAQKVRAKEEDEVVYAGVAIRI